MVCAERDGEITRVFVDRITRSGKNTEIKAKPKRNRKHMKLAERRTKPHPVRGRRRPILNNYSNGLTWKSGCIFVVVPLTVQGSPPPFLRTDFPRHFTVLPFLYSCGFIFHGFCLLYSHCDLRPTRNVASRWWSSPLPLWRCWPPQGSPVVPRDGERAGKGASGLRGKSTVLVIWTVGCKEKNILSVIIPLPEWALILKKQSQEDKYIPCANTQLP